MNSVNRNTITGFVEEWSHKTFGKDFEFRKYQKEACVNVIFNFLSGTKNYIIEAPTGSGKSIIAMIVAGVLSEYYDKTGYILISDLSLIQQYERDIDKYLPDWGVIKGQDNYSCLSNSMSFKLGDCRLHGERGYNDLEEKYSECSPYCEYLIARKRAKSAKVTVCTYHHWFTYQNMNLNVGGFSLQIGSDFSERDFIICDEAHKLVDIVQSIYSFQITNVERNNIDTIKMGSDKEFGTLRNSIQKSFDKIIDYRDDVSNMIPEMEKLYDKLSSYYDDATKVMRNAHSYGLDGGKLYRFIRACYWLGDYSESIGMFLESIGTNYDDVVVTYIENENGLNLNCLNEKYLMNKYFHPHFKNCLYMSATIGDMDLYANNCHINSYKSEVIPSTFDFTKSPIFYCNEYKMNYANKNLNLPGVISMVDKILGMFVNQRGCILTSSYDMAQKICDGVSPANSGRVLLYSDSKDKRDVLDRYKFQDGMVIVGPSLFDGLSFDDDLCRFLIIAKVPYPDLKNNFIKKKMDKNYDWYSGCAALSVIQGVGRGVRSESDWCYSFILDGCFDRLITSSSAMFSQQFKDRLINIDRNFNVAK